MLMENILGYAFAESKRKRRGIHAFYIASLLLLGIDGVEFGFEGWGVFGQLLD